MRVIIIYLFALLICSCSKTEEIMSTATNGVKISCSIGVDMRTNPLDENESQRKVFNTGDQIAVSNGGVAVAYRNTGNTWSPSVEETFLKWEESTMDFTAYHPLESSMDKFVTPGDQSTLEKIATADWMTATTMNQSQGNGAVNFTFQRKMAKVKIVISAFGDQYAPESAVSDIKILGISPYQVASVAGEGKQGSSYTALVNPAEVVGQSSFITLNVNDSNKEQVIDVPTFNAAMSYTFNLRIGKNGMVLTLVSVEEWQSGEPINGNANWVVVNNIADGENNRNNKLKASLINTLGAGYAERIRSVKIAGTMNEADFQALKGFEEVDLSEVTVVGNVFVGTGDNYQDINKVGNAIPWSAFAGLSSSKPNIIKKLVLPSNIEAIGEDAFWHCTNLKLNLDIIQNLTYLGMGAFNECNSMSGELFISEQLSEIASSTFLGCRNLTGSLTIPSNIKHIESYAFNGCYGFAGTLTLSEGVESIENGAFFNCRNLTGTVIIPKTVTSIASQAFYNCNNIISFEVLWKESIPTITGTVFPSQFKVNGGEKEITIPFGKKADYEAVGWGAYNLVERTN